MLSASRGLAPREGLECLVDEDGSYRPASTATPWAAGRQVWGPPFPEHRHPDPKARSVSKYPLSDINQGMRGNQA